MTPRLLTKYRDEIVAQLQKKFGYKNKLQAPRLEKIVINMGVGAALADIKILDEAKAQLALITGQQPVVTRAKKAIANFKIKKGMPIGCKVTLRGARMYEFLDRFISVALPRIRDFNGVSPDSFDEGGNFAMGLKEQLVFPEVEADKVTRTQGMDIIISIKSHSKDESRELLGLMGMPFKK